ncbi:Hpt domain-containing protein [Aquimarina intermedia]|uniref:HPt (Histidine-containing phosphotransfer) domain-containing protein n=1 Tax=Aquimarina intermedia TaxID=350814 RepID=A0A5S5BV58_9FLAO|nr:Hpt domain-containing protein [Aquimarina intermedia]TYP70844.1 HPt (histidine-containing phosphotransfer) domain-containing protein [Aquimarina intermedia]
MSKGYSLNHINELSGGDQEFAAVLVQTFLEEIPPDLENMVEAVKSDNPGLAYQYAHKMKPNLQLFDIDLLSQIKQVEAWAKTNKSKSEILPTIDHIVLTVNAAIEDLKNDFQ